MPDAGILDGDLVAVHRTPEVRARQIIVARMDNEVTVKRYRQEGHRVWKMPENP
jgi:repressor LexA